VNVQILEVPVDFIGVKEISGKKRVNEKKSKNHVFKKREKKI
jgi:hypothetical protein